MFFNRKINLFLDGDDGKSVNEHPAQEKLKNELAKMNKQLADMLLFTQSGIRDFKEKSVCEAALNLDC